MGAEDIVSEFVGIDVSKATLDVYLHDARSGFTVANDEAGLKGLSERLAGAQPELIVLEATGGYERLCAASLARAGFTVAIVNPRQVRSFAIAIGVLAKSDKADARVLAHFAAAVRPEVRARCPTKCSAGDAGSWLCWSRRRIACSRPARRW
jgi:transposase